MPQRSKTIAYFSMEVALDPAMPTYSGGLGILAGDTIRAAADLSVPMVAVTLLHRQGYLRQKLDPSGWQTESPVEWPVAQFLTEMPYRASVTIENRTVYLRAWRYQVTGVDDFRVPIFFLDTDLPENSPADRTLTHWLYGGDDRYRLCQEVVLGIGGVRMLRALGHGDESIARYHMNEGHAALLALELLREQAADDDRDIINQQDVDAVRRSCVFTTHTPVPAGHDQFPLELVRSVLPRQPFTPDLDWRTLVCVEGRLNMTFMALNLSHFVNGVAKRHAEVSQQMFHGHHVNAITNGVHATFWTAPAMATLFDRYVPDWRHDNFSLRGALNLPRQELWQAHTAAKQALLDYVRAHTGKQMTVEALTLGFARRATAYKRPDLLFSNPQRLREIIDVTGPLQIIFSGKAHPRDEEGKKLIQRVFQAAEALKDKITIVYLEDYDLNIARLMTAGVDVWLNTPLPPMEASGTSGMKAAINGVPSLSVLDGWWLEGWIEGVTGWSVGFDGVAKRSDPADDAKYLYEKLTTVASLYYRNRDRFIEVMVHAIALNGSFFNTHRMMQQYVTKAYFD